MGLLSSQLVLSDSETKAAFLFHLFLGFSCNRRGEMDGFVFSLGLYFSPALFQLLFFFSFTF